MRPKFLFNVIMILLLIIYPVSGWTAERVIEKTDGTVISVLTDYEREDVIRVTGSQLTEEDWAELRKMWSVEYHLILDNGQREIPDMALSTNGMLPSPVISITGAQVISIGSLAFANNNYLMSTDFPALESISEMAFFSCFSLQEFELPKSMNILEDGVFAMCKRLESISVADECDRYKSIDGVVYSADGKTLCAYPAGKKQREYVSDALEIRPFSFYGAENLVRVSLTSAVTIGNGTFVMCEFLSGVELPEGLKAIGHGVFDSCLSLSAITLPASLEWIGDGAFSYCERLRSISMPQGSAHFESIDGVLYSSDGEILYAYPADRRNTHYISNAKEIRPYAFMYTGNLQEVSLPDAATIGEGAFAWCSSLTVALLPSAVSLGNGTFAWCSSLKLMMLKNQAPVIEPKTFTSDETSFLIVAPREEIEYNLESWPSGVRLASLRGAALGPVTVKQGEKLTFSLDIEGAAEYRWKKDGVTIDGANGVTYEKPEADLSDSGTYGVAFKYDMGSGPVDFEVNSIEVVVVP